MLKIEKDNITSYNIIRLSKTKGIKILFEKGFKQCLNHNYYKKENVYLHFNNILKVWIVE